ncbi:MAG TPA: DUF167 domain-containing protein [Pyrinomonadaceae bacterium]|nr:DUF167 domain-containing protein [Pyrinomonadaceae bacterium]
MINYSETKDKLSFTVRVVPRASRTQIVGEADGALRVRVAAPPVDGAANDELVRVLARALKVSRSAVAITAGQTSRLKRVAVSGIAPEALLTLGKVSD